MYKSFVNDSLNNIDLNIYSCGIEECTPGHYFGPSVRDHYLIHYVLDGKGFFQVGDYTYNLEKGQGFLICPNTLTYYEADKSTPWKYTWVGFYGTKAEYYLKQANLTQESPIFTYTRDSLLETCLTEIVESSKLTKNKEIKLTGLLYIFLYNLISNSEMDTIKASLNLKEDYIKNALLYIERNYSRKIYIQDIADYININRAYLHKLFKEMLNISPQQYLINYRIEKACELLNNPLLTIGDVSRSVGYYDTFLFSKIFKKIKGLSPSSHRNLINSNLPLAKK